MAAAVEDDAEVLLTTEDGNPDEDAPAVDESELESEGDEETNVTADEAAEEEREEEEAAAGELETDEDGLREDEIEAEIDEGLELLELEEIAEAEAVAAVDEADNDEETEAVEELLMLLTLATEEEDTAAEIDDDET